MNKMETMIAYCGLVCDTCPIHLATLERNISIKAEMRVRIAEDLARIYGTTPKPEIITDCDGCKESEGRLFTGCAGCEIRNCAITRDMKDCAFCPDYVCDKLKRHFIYDPDSQKRLEERRSKNLYLR